MYVCNINTPYLYCTSFMVSCLKLFHSTGWLSLYEKLIFRVNVSETNVEKCDLKHINTIKLHTYCKVISLNKSIKKLLLKSMYTVNYLPNCAETKTKKNLNFV